MKPAAREWIAKAEADFLSAQREYRARNRPNFDARRTRRLGGAPTKASLARRSRTERWADFLKASESIHGLIDRS
jgi:hypothetical protein